jgi:ABC-type uncharacterized transport system substrate-binding protein
VCDISDPDCLRGGGKPLGVGIVASFARPGGNVTGLTNQLTELAGKRLELLRAIVPGRRRIGMMNVVGSQGSWSPLSELETSQVQVAADMLGLDFIRLEILQKVDIAIAFNGLKDRADALYVANRPFLFTKRMRITTCALVARLPTVFAIRDRSMQAACCLMARISRTCSGGPPNTLIKFCGARARLTSPSSSQRNPISP